MTGLVFSQQRMIERLNREGRGAEITPEITAIMDALDGREAIEHCWQRQVFDEPVYFVTFAEGKIPAGYKGTGEYVNENDCVPLSVWESER